MTHMSRAVFKPPTLIYAECSSTLPQLSANVLKEVFKKISITLVKIGFVKIMYVTD